MNKSGRQSASETRSGFQPRKQPRWGLIALILALHVLVAYGLPRALAPDFTARVIDQATAAITVDIDPPEKPEATPSPTQSPEPDEGAAAEEGREAVAREVVAPENPLPRPSPAPRAASTGTADASGARDAGEGTGAGGEGEGTGSGRSGSGQGGIPVSGPVKIAGDIRSASDYPAPEGGRETRFGQSVTIHMTVGVDGRASNCRVAEPSNDPVADRITCQLAVERFRFEPARDAAGNPVPATYGWRQEFFRAR